MPNVSRRSFLAGAAAIPFSIWLEKYGWAQAPRVRFDARSTQGQAMLKLYAKAVDRMKNATAEGNPTSWVFQWYTHFVKSSTTKTAEIARIYPSPSAWKSLATEMWNTCQSHSGQDENFFLPWHRMFVYFFESIVRQASGDATFTLPYWNYSTSDTTIRGVMPTQFRQSSDPLFKSLFVSKRNPGVNSGQPIQQGQPGDPLSLSSLRQCTYKPVGTAIQGFCLNLDANLHGNIHVLVGNTQNMGAVPWAAGDPIFWMHHCNIDRLWASWNAGGRKNPTDASFLAKTFIFADADGRRVVAKIQDFLDVAKLGYKYDRLEPVPACPPLSLAAAAPKTHVKAKAPVAFGTGPTEAALGAGAAAGVNLPDRVKKLPPDKRLYLVAKGLHADAQPGVLYHIYLEKPPAASGAQADPYYVGSVNLFDAVHQGDHGGGAGSQKFHCFDITDLAKRLAAKNQLKAEPHITIVPAGQPAAEAKPVCNDLSIVEQ